MDPLFTRKSRGVHLWREFTYEWTEKIPCSAEHRGCAFTTKSRGRDRDIACIYGGCAFMEGAFMEVWLYAEMAKPQNAKPCETLTNN